MIYRLLTPFREIWVLKQSYACPCRFMHESGERGQFIQKKNFLLLAVNVYGRKIYEKMSKLLCKMHRGTCAFCWFWKWRENPADGIIFSYVNVYENHSLTGELGRRPIMKQVTIKDIAREAGVSIASVSRALNGMDGISEENRGPGNLLRCTAYELPAGWCCKEGCSKRIRTHGSGCGYFFQAV